MVKDGLVDADELAGKMERLILNVEDQYVDYLSNLKENININRSTEIPPKREMAGKYQYKKVFESFKRKARENCQCKISLPTQVYSIW